MKVLSIVLDARRVDDDQRKRLVAAGLELEEDNDLLYVYEEREAREATITN